MEGAASYPRTVSIRFVVHRRVDLGEEILIVGNHPTLGDWVPANTTAVLKWGPGDEWSTVPAQRPDRPARQLTMFSDGHMDCQQCRRRAGDRRARVQVSSDRIWLTHHPLTLWAGTLWPPPGTIRSQSGSPIRIGESASRPWSLARCGGGLSKRDFSSPLLTVPPSSGLLVLGPPQGARDAQHPPADAISLFLLLAVRFGPQPSSGKGLFSFSDISFSCRRRRPVPPRSHFCASTSVARSSARPCRPSPATGPWTVSSSRCHAARPLPRFVLRPSPCLFCQALLTLILSG